MKAVIFAGGVGTRLWPLSRRNSPKQFEKIFGDKSTLQLTVERLLPDFAPDDIYIATSKRYTKAVAKQLPSIPKQNIIGEPQKKDVGPAVGLVMGYLFKKYPREPVIILWSDHLVKREAKFREILKAAGEIIKHEKDKIIFIGQRPNFASENLGWIELGSRLRTKHKIELYRFRGFKYRPDGKTAQKYFKSTRHCWNLGYFVSTPQFVYSQFKRFSPQIYSVVEKILKSAKKIGLPKALEREYDTMPVVNFDNAVIEQLDPDCAYVINEDIGWSDLGAWEALKDALEKHRRDNITKGKVLLNDCVDNLIYNYERGKTVTCIDLREFVVINTKDVLLVTRKSSVGKIKELVESLENTEYEDLI